MDWDSDYPPLAERAVKKRIMPVVLCFGNPDIPEDAVAVELGRSLDVPGFTFVHLTSPEDIVDYRTAEKKMST